MGKISQYLLILGIVIVLCYFAGILKDTASATLLNFLINPENFKTMGWLQIVEATLSAVAVTGIIAGLIKADSSIWAIKAAVGAALLTIGWDILAIFHELTAGGGTTIIALATLLVSPLLIVYIIAVIEWVGGHD